jgi:hypothetical protein
VGETVGERVGEHVMPALQQYLRQAKLRQHSPLPARIPHVVRLS